MAGALARFMESNYLVKLLGTGGFSDVWVSIDKLQANTVLDRHLAGEIDDGQAICEVQESFVASKILDMNTPGYNLNDEIAVLLEMNVLSHRNIVRMHDYQHDKFDKEWTKFEALSCGTLEQYAEKVAEWEGDSFVGVAPAAFGWHIIHQLSQALIAILFPVGAKTSFFAHGDFEPRNILFRGPQSFPSPNDKGYPDVVVADMGLSTNLADQPIPEKRMDFFEQQYTDVRQMLCAICGIFPALVGMNDLVTSLNKIETENSTYMNSNSALKTWLEKLIDDSKALRAWGAFNQNGEFGPEAKQYFDRRTSTADEASDFWIKLKTGQAHLQHDDSDAYE